MSKLASSYEPLYLDPLCIQLERPGKSKRRNFDRSVFGYGAPVDMHDYCIASSLECFRHKVPKFFEVYVIGTRGFTEA